MRWGGDREGEMEGEDEIGGGEMKACTMGCNNSEGITSILKYLKSSEYQMILLLRLFSILTGFPIIVFQKELTQ